ncbi:MAG: hypothetical protein B6D64_11285 [Bacteroidetes bacterium 4484_276]|nr:MAG: hypothetical protein B6D64_11285 [Bacteroidetes bacterium 4484_276]OYT13795.1 MAG: hypothetical protein B6I19_03280 [Bacteroidetes bacterium 4572_114]
MKTRSTIIALFFALLMSPALDAQEMNYQDFLDEANTSIKSEDYKEAINSLQMAISEIEKLMIVQIRETLPAEVMDYKADQSDDESSATAAMGMFGGGLSVERNYFKNPGDWDNYFKLSVLGNSPLLASVNMMLSNSMYLNSAGGKVIKVGARKGMMTDEGEGDFKFQLPLNSSLISVEGYGFSSSSAFMAVINKINFEEIAKALGE